MPGKRLRQAISLKLSAFSRRFNHKTPRGDVSHVVAPYTATNASELSVHEGQTVYVVKAIKPRNIAEPGFCLIRVLDDGTKRKEGLVPVHILSPLPQFDQEWQRGEEQTEREVVEVRSEDGRLGNAQSGSRSDLDVESDFRVRSASSGNIPRGRSADMVKRRLAVRHKSGGGTGSDSLSSITSNTSTGEDKSTSHLLKSSMRLELIDFPVTKQSMTASLTESTASCNMADDLSENMEGVCLSDGEDIGDRPRTSLSSHQDSVEENNNEAETPEPPPLDPQQEQEKIEQAREKRKFVLHELLETERGYVEDLATVVEGYMVEINSLEDPPPDLKEKEKMIFGNVRQIYEFHKQTFLPEIEEHHTNVQALGTLFKRHERRLLMYVRYCENKPKSEYIIAEYADTVFQEIKTKLKQRLQIQDLMIKPVQRIMKYQLLLKDILKYTGRCQENTEALNKALDVMHIVPKAANDMMELGRLQGYEGHFAAQGRILLQATVPTIFFNLQKSDTLKFKDRRLFLFEQLLIFSDLANNPLTGHYYKYKCSYKFSNMTLCGNVAESPLIFTITVKPTKGESRIIYFSMTQMETKQLWMNTLQKQIDMHGDFVNALVSPIAFQNGTLDRNTRKNHKKTMHEVNRSQSDRLAPPSSNEIKPNPKSPNQSPRLFNRKKYTFSTSDS